MIRGTTLLDIETYARFDPVTEGPSFPTEKKSSFGKPLGGEI